jgi:thiol:disulfide interchange protein DsbD
MICGGPLVLRAIIPLIFSLLFFPLSVCAQGVGEHHTLIRLVAEVSRVQPGSSFLAGLLMKMDPGWHTYWKNPGEAGLATKIRWTLPGGVTARDIEWPAPHKYTEGGEVITYGYADETMLIIPMTVSDLPDSVRAIRLRAEVDWLECEKVCLPGSGVVELELPVSNEIPEEVNAPLFDRYIDRIPAPLRKGLPFTFSSEARNSAIHVRIDDPGRALRFEIGESPDIYPEPNEGIETGRTEVSISGTTVTMTVPLRLVEQGVFPDRFRGLLVYETSKGSRVTSAIEVPISQEFGASIRSAGGDTQAGSVLDQEFVLEEGEGWGGQPLYVYLFFALVGGMLLNIMPCVLPVIGLKVFGLVKMGGEDPRRIRKLGWFFSLGILVSFLVLAVLVIVLKTAGEQVGWGFQFQEPVFVMVMSAVVMAFGLSLFGVFEIQLPAAATMGVSGLVTKAGKAGNTGTGSFTEGIFATILATPCTAPILGTALGFAFSQPAPTILLVFLFVAIGMALPYLVLTLRPAWMKILPKPGEWMVTAKQFMGFLMMATLLWLLYVLGKQVGMEAVIWTCAFLLMVGIACWLVGRFATLTATKGKFWLTWIAAAAIVVAGWIWFAQPIVDAKEVLSPDAAGPETNGEIQWEPFSLEALDSHLSEGKAVFIDFTAEWCLTCKVNEKTVLADEDVVRKFESSGIVPVKADWTNRNTDITQLLSKFGRSGVPLYVVFPAGRPTEPIVLPEVITAGIVIDALEKGVGG